MELKRADCKFNKKGQFYLFTSIILIILLVSIIPRTIKIFQPETIFLELYENYVEELTFAIDSAIYEEVDIYSRVDDYNEQFLDYAKSRDKEFGFLLMLRVQNETMLFNSLPEKATLKSLSGAIIILDSGENDLVGIYEGFDVTITEGTYNFDFEGLPIERKLLFKSFQNDNIYIKEIY